MSNLENRKLTNFKTIIRPELNVLGLTTTLCK